MIKISSPSSEQILHYHLNLVADVVPFLPDDVLYNIPKASDSVSDVPRKRDPKKNKAYLDLLEHWKIPTGGSDKEQRIHDAELAEKLISKYSKDLHDKLYGKDYTDGGAVKDRTLLQNLFTSTIPHKNASNSISDLKVPEEPNEDGKLLLKYVFRYDKYSEKKEPSKKNPNKRPRDVYQLLDMMNVEICPYCNRQFISTVSYGKKQVRAQLDHFRNKDKYPFLALSIGNLIPSCAVCNLLKHNNDPDMLYPYDEGIGNYYIFRANYDNDNITSLLTGADDAIQKFQLNLDRNIESPKNEDLQKRIDESLDTLALRELYQFNKKHVVALFRQRYVLTKALLDDTKHQFKDLFDKKEDLRYALRLMDYSPDKWGEQPLSKLTHDISDQIDKLYENKPLIQMLLSSNDVD